MQLLDTTFAQDLATAINLDALTTAIQPYVTFIGGVAVAAFVLYIVRKVIKGFGNKGKIKM